MNKQIALILGIAFLAQQMAFAAGSPQLRTDISKEMQKNAIGLQTNPASLTIDANIATLSDSFKGDSGKLIIHFQDAHTNLEAQLSLSKTLESLIGRFGIDLVFVEGGTGNDSLSFLREYATPEKRRSVAKRFLERGEIAGEEYLDIISDQPFLLWGIEDPELYNASVESYRQVTQTRTQASDYLNKIQRLLDKVKTKLYPRDLYALEQKIESSKQNPEFLNRYMTLLNQAAGNQQLAIETYTVFNQWRDNPNSDATHLNSLDARHLLEEMNALEEKVLSSGDSDENVRELRALSKKLKLLKSYFSLQLRPADYRWYRNHPEEFQTLNWLGFLNRKLVDLKMYEDVLSYDSIVDTEQEKVAQFYETVQARDSEFVNRALSKMDEENRQIAVLICGGYHTPHLTSLLKKEQISYVVITPHLSEQTDIQNYERLLLQNSTVRLRAAKDRPWVIQNISNRLSGARLALPRFSPMSTALVKESITELEKIRASLKGTKSHPGFQNVLSQMLMVMAGEDLEMGHRQLGISSSVFTQLQSNMNVEALVDDIDDIDRNARKAIQILKSAPQIQDMLELYIYLASMHNLIHGHFTMSTKVSDFYSVIYQKLSLSLMTLEKIMIKIRRYLREREPFVSASDAILAVGQTREWLELIAKHGVEEAYGDKWEFADSRLESLMYQIMSFPYIQDKSIASTGSLQIDINGRFHTAPDAIQKRLDDLRELAVDQAFS